MAADDTLVIWDARGTLSPSWLFVKFTSGSHELTVGEVLHGDTSDAYATIEYIEVTSGTWASDAAGWMLLSKWDGTAWTSGENVTGSSSTPANDATLTLVPENCFATLGTRNGKPVLNFDDTDNEVAIFEGTLIQNYDGGGVVLHVKWMSEDQTTLDTSWQAFFKSITDDVDDIDTKTFVGPQINQAVDVPSASGEVGTFTIAFTHGAQMDSLAVGEKFYILLVRDAQDTTNDDMTNDAQVIGLELREA